ncbi:hypothetical protein D8I35_08470 [Corticibacter populi]|uniref:Iron uptake system protein EfeO n=1 Tax=Corticibacter populi TaxID=1550736 RepID=A0A3M6QU32_9BURK|nr:iron uptake system protein EfeO [Corticibacter populi]RMX06544.1 hypothetical protein D8I35_08470 [Corticibacter populi]RZS31892.1 iron uptake system component EfeO [Corticibacter populi]
MTTPHHDTPSATQQPRDKAPSALVPWALGLALLLVLAGLALFYYATRTATGPQRGSIHKVVVGDSSCEPADFKLPAGLTTFEIHNASRRPLEWEILDGVMVVAERENIAPGFHSLLTVKLRPGSFAITCGLLSNPRGTLEVTPTTSSEAERLRPPLQSFIGPLSEQRVFLIMQGNAMEREAQALAAAVEAGDLDAARAHWLAARLPYKRIEAVAGRFADLESRIDPQADYLQGREEDPGFTGFHRLEKALFEQHTLDGLAPVAQQLAEDAGQLKGRIRALQQKPEDLAGSALWQAERLRDGALEHGQNPYAQSDLADLQANLEGMAKSVLLLGELLQGASAELATRVRADFDGLDKALQSLQVNGAFPAYREIAPAQRAELDRRLEQLAQGIAQVNPALGLE